ncbi:MAG: YciI family protein [Rhodobiaceae bacterium]|nr:YciI-like protein [Rhodobiaceae bacterium]MCR9242347.1 YciI family protein [Rhodobiaceae bacterium]
MLFCIVGIDKPDSLDLRMANRDNHLKHWAETGAVKLGGPFTSDDGERLEGSMLVIDVADRATAQKLADEDPYVKAGLFGTRELRAWKWLLKE